MNETAGHTLGNKLGELISLPPNRLMINSRLTINRILIKLILE